MVKKPAVSPVWQDVLRKAWSVRLSAVASIFMAAEIALPILSLDIPQYVFVLLALTASIGSIWARVLIQKNMRESVDE